MSEIFTTVNSVLGNSTTTGSMTFENAEFTTSFITPSGQGFEMKKKKGLPPVLTFKLIKKKLGIIEGHVLQRRTDALLKLAEQSQDFGQNALAGKMLEQVERQLRESEMYAANFRMFIEGELLEKFIAKTEGKRDLLMTKLAEFTRVIPKDVQKKLAKAQERKLFDEYIILHYDPELKNISPEKKKEIETARKDPIIFGVIKESTRFYFVGDWVDEYCDLTFDDILAKQELEEEDVTLPKKPEPLTI